MTRRLQHASLALAIVFALAALAIRYYGGYEFELLGVQVRGHRVDRVLWASLLFLSAYSAFGGRIWYPRLVEIRRANDLVAEWALPLRRHPHRVALALTAGVFVVGLTLGSRAVGGSDSYGYMSQAHLWLSGSLVQPQPWSVDVPWPVGPETFQPLGYRVGLDGTSLVPVYSPGLPLIMAGAILIGGACAAFLVVPLMGAGLVYATYRLGLVLRSAWVGVAAAWFVASSPTFFFVFVQPMSDVPVAAAWAGAFLLAWKGSTPAAAAAGLLTGLAVLIRINHAPFVVALALWFAALAWRDRERAGVSAWIPFVAFCASVVPGVIVAAGFNAALFGSPFNSGYGPGTYLFRWENVWPNLMRYPAWISDTQTPLVWAGVMALVVPLRRWWPSDRARLMVRCAALFVSLLWVQHCLYAFFEEWWYLRFLLAAAPFVFVALAVVGRDALGLLPTFGRAPVATMVLMAPMILALWRVHYAYDFRSSQAYYPMTSRVVERATEPTAVIYTMQHSGSVRYYAGRMTLRYDYVNPQWLDRSVEWLAAHGAHPYALLEGWEVEAWRKQFGSSTALGRLDFQPIRRFAKPDGMVLYDLLAPTVDAVRTVSATPDDLECRPPARPASFSFSNTNR